MKNYVKSAASKLLKLLQKLKNHRKSTALKVLLLLALVAISVTVILFGCDKSTDNTGENPPEYVAGSKDEILSNISASVEKEGNEYETVMEYLKFWGIGKFDTTKFSYFETRFIALYNFEDGLPETESHAKDTAMLYLDTYYGEIDTTNTTAVTDSLLYCYVDSLGDPYSVYRPPVESDDYTTDMSGKFGGIGVIIEYNDKNETIQVTTVYPDSPAEKAGIMVGDYIHAIDGVTVEEIGYRNAVYHVRGEIGTKVELTLLRGGDYITLTAIRAEVAETNVDYTFDAETGIGYVQIVAFKGNTFEQFKNAIDELENLELKGIVFDVRGNPGGYVDSVCSVMSYILPSDKTVLSYQYKGDASAERKTKDDGTAVSDTDGTTTGIDHIISVPMVVLCNEYTASAGEIFTAALRDHREGSNLDVTIVGTATFGKGIMQNSYTYSDGSSVTLTVAYYNPPCGINYHGAGIIPDITVELPEAERDPITDALLPIEDTQLDAAISELQELINAK